MTGLIMSHREICTDKVIFQSFQSQSVAPESSNHVCLPPSSSSCSSFHVVVFILTDNNNNNNFSTYSKLKD